MNSNGAYQEIKTNIVGLDKLLFNRLEVPANGNITIAIRGDDIMDRTCLGLQLLYGLGQSYDLLHETHNTEPVSLRFISSCMAKPYLDDLLLDMLITTGIQHLTRRYISGLMGNGQLNRFASVWFNMDEIMCLKYANVVNNIPLSDIKEDTDRLISEEAIYYSLRTNALHFRNLDRRSDEMNILYERKHNSIQEYFKDNEGIAMKNLGKSLDYRLINMEIMTSAANSYVKLSPDKVNLLGIDLTAMYDCCDNSGCCAMMSMLKHYKAMQGRSILVVLLPEQAKLPKNTADIVIDMKTVEVSNYQLNYLSIITNRLQQTALGWHQYKQRDRVIEIYPSLHTYFSERRYLQRALVYTHSNVISETFQQYLNNNSVIGNRNASYLDYQNTKTAVSNRYYDELYPVYSHDFNSVDILERILLSESLAFKQTRDWCESGRGVDLDSRNVVRGYRGGVTAVIGKANTYKRFLTFGGIFSSALNREHTLLLLLDKDEAMIRRRLACPARRGKEAGCKDCKLCYSYIHFMNICMGNITPDEFIYQLERQIDVAFACGKKIKRIVIDELQVLDFCFPLLKENPLFIPALVSVCRERGISLYLLCDKRGQSVGTLRAVADNIICTDRDKDGKLLLYIERFAGYNNTPSKIYCGRINKVQDLFECYTRLNENEVRQSFYALRSTVIEDRPTSSMDVFWSGV